MEITIQGLNPKQRLFADILWSLNGQSDVNRFINSLPTAERREATVVMNMMVAAVFDQLVNDDLSAAQDLIKRVSR